ncbi:MAG: alpha/beta hydrolase [Flavobacteriales bacterium]|nr:alpha/beta hydrolase [Flavobacteriales bacterium]
MRASRIVAAALLLCWGGAAVAQRTGPAQPFALGVTETIRSNVLGEDRILHIALPQGYHPDSAARYPVIYLLDGGADEDFIHIAGVVQFAAFPWIGWLRPSIVVGIANVDRERDLTFPTTIAADKEKFPTSGGSMTFMHFIFEELFPFMAANYRTEWNYTLIGQSFGGLFAAEVLLKHPGLFHRYVIVSPSLWWDGGSLLKTPPGLGPDQVYIAVGKEGSVMVRGAKKLARLARKDPTVEVRFSHLKDHDHANILHRAVLDAVRWMGER